MPARKTARINQKVQRQPRTTPVDSPSQERREYQQRADLSRLPIARVMYSSWEQTVVDIASDRQDHDYHDPVDPEQGNYQRLGTVHYSASHRATRRTLDPRGQHARLRSHPPL